MKNDARNGADAFRQFAQGYKAAKIQLQNNDPFANRSRGASSWLGN